MENKYNGYYYGNTNKWYHNRTDKFIEENKDKKLWALSLYFSNNRLAKYQRAGLCPFWDGYKNEFVKCKTTDLTKYNGLYTFEEAFKLFKEFPLQDYEAIRLNFDEARYYKGYYNECSLNHFILVRNNIGDI